MQVYICYAVDSNVKSKKGLSERLCKLFVLVDHSWSHLALARMATLLEFLCLHSCDLLLSARFYLAYLLANSLWGCR